MKDISLRVYTVVMVLFWIGFAVLWVYSEMNKAKIIEQRTLTVKLGGEAIPHAQKKELEELGVLMRTMPVTEAIKLSTAIGQCEDGGWGHDQIIYAFPSILR